MFSKQDKTHQAQKSKQNINETSGEVLCWQVQMQFSEALQNIKRDTIYILHEHPIHTTGTRHLHFALTCSSYYKKEKTRTEI